MANKKTGFQNRHPAFSHRHQWRVCGAVLWLRFQDGGQFWLAQLLLWGGFLVERSAVILWLRFVNDKDDPETIANATPARIAGAIVLLTFVEIVIWAVWLFVADGMGALLGTLVLAVMIHSLHSIEMAVVKKTPLGAYFTNLNTIFFSVMEVMGGALWLYLVRGGNEMLGAACLLIGLSVEHVIQGASLKRSNEAPKMMRAVEML
ncbi:MAG: hypothetical protein HC853_07105 [Anaerolineae bacterium]|nr:hypothetical protein [Anaerolineae bacterium]